MTIDAPGGKKSRLHLSSTCLEMAIDLSGGNPGALNVLMQSLGRHEEIDPDDFAGRLGLFLHLDSMGIYDERIWMFFKDLCGEDLSKMAAVARAWQLGIISLDLVNQGIDKPWAFDWTILDQVLERLPNFRLDT